MSQADFDKWEAKYARLEGPDVGEPEPFVVQTLAGQPAAATDAGRALDVAGGTGRHALALAAAGWQVHLLDISPAGLARAAQVAAARGLTLTTDAIDLDAPRWPEGVFDAIVITWFLLPDARWQDLVERLAPNG